MDARKVERVYSIYSGFYDLLFGKVFHKSRANAIELLDIQPGEKILEVGVGTGLSLPLFPPDCDIIGIDLSGSMLKKGWKRIKRQNMTNVTLRKMDATRMDFPDNTFDSVLAAYVISTVPDPQKVVREMVRVCKNGGKVVFLNHFRNGNKIISIFEKSVSPICKRIGFRTDLDLGGILKDTPLTVHRKKKTNPFHPWKAVQCINDKQPADSKETFHAQPTRPRSNGHPHLERQEEYSPS